MNYYLPVKFLVTGAMYSPNVSPAVILSRGIFTTNQCSHSLRYGLPGVGASKSKTTKIKCKIRYVVQTDSLELLYDKFSSSQVNQYSFVLKVSLSFLFTIFLVVKHVIHHTHTHYDPYDPSCHTPAWCPPEHPRWHGNEKPSRKRRLFFGITSLFCLENNCPTTQRQMERGSHSCVTSSACPVPSATFRMLLRMRSGGFD